MVSNSFLVLIASLAVSVAAPAEDGPVLFKTFDEVKGALLAGQHLSAWVSLGKCSLLAPPQSLDVTARGTGGLVSDFLPGGEDATPKFETWTQKFEIWQWMSKIENQELFWFPSHQNLGGGEFASERVLLWQNGTVFLDIVTFGSDKNGTTPVQMGLNCTMGTSALFRGWSDMMKPVDNAADAIAANAQQATELSVVTIYENCTRIKGEDDAPPTVQVIGGHAMSDALTGKDENGAAFYMGSSSFIERTPDMNVRAFGDDVIILANGTVLVDTFLDFFLGDNVVHRDYYAACEFGKNILVFA